MSQYVPDTNPPVQIERTEELTYYFESACKPREQWRVGTEHEKPVVRREDGRAAPFSGPNGIETLLRQLGERFGWEPLLEEGRVIALKREGGSITLEPGGQLELSGQAFVSLHDTASELRRHLTEVLAVTEGLGLAPLTLGMTPISRLDDIEWVPKKRYRIMAPYMARVGTMGHRMMKQTATVQVNLDYASEADAMAKMRAGMGIAPLLLAMFANSPLCDGALNGFLSFRGHVWSDTDNARSGLLKFVFDHAAGFESYAEYALDVPMYLIIRGDDWIDMTDYTFRRFMREGFRAERATLSDWNLHLTTLFPEVRLKGYIELRSCDSQDTEMALALPALAKGVLYDDDALAATWDLVKGWSWEQRLALQRDVPRGGLAVRVGRVSLGDLAKELLRIAEYGLNRARVVDAKGRDEAIYLERLIDLVRQGRCPADRVREKWVGEWKQEPRALVEGTIFRG
jgi:glutamate--cysteine ligase